MLWSQAGGMGGGAIALIVNSTASSLLDLNGTIRVNGVAGTYDCSGASGDVTGAVVGIQV